MRDVLGDRIILQAFRPAFPSIARVFDAAERRFGHGSDEMIDREIAGLDIVR
jgi:hypothetical protein